MNSSVSSIFNFDIPSTYTGKCSLIFLLPSQKNLTTSSFTLSGSGQIDFAQLKNSASTQTSFLNKGDVEVDWGQATVKPGSSTIVGTFPCPAGKQVAFEAKAVGNLSLNYFQANPVGLYITAC